MRVKWYAIKNDEGLRYIKSGCLISKNAFTIQKITWLIFSYRKVIESLIKEMAYCPAFFDTGPIGGKHWMGIFYFCLGDSCCSFPSAFQCTWGVFQRAETAALSRLQSTSDGKTLLTELLSMQLPLSFTFCYLEYEDNHNQTWGSNALHKNPTLNRRRLG